MFSIQNVQLEDAGRYVCTVSNEAGTTRDYGELTVDGKNENDSIMFLPRCMKCRRGLAMRILSVRLSVRLSVKRVHCDKTEERSVQIFIPYERSFSLVFREEEWLVGGDHFYLKFWVNRPPLERNRRF